MKCRLFLAALALGAVVLPGGKGSAQDFPYLVFERYVEPLAQQIGMPGLAAVIVRNNIIEWERGYGFANVETRTPADIDTPFPIGGVTQAITGVLIGICADRHQLEVDDPIRKWVPTFPDESATVRHVLAHASAGRYQYDAAKFTALTAVVEGCTKQPYRIAATTELLDRLALTRSVPGLDLNRPEGAAARALFDERALSRYLTLLNLMAVPYRINRNGGSTRSEYPSYGVDASGGLVATARDLANFEASLDDREDNIPLSLSTLNKMWSPTVIQRNPNEPAVTTPTGQGWFVQNASGQRLVWTFGHIPDAGSALILKMPSKRLTLILLANSGGLAAGNNFEAGDVTTSPFVKVFLRLFIN